ncbi:molybdopterin-dependent oxidoreductase [Nocardia sp. NBC_01499]|uniref:molybdopterin-dependent oxidoreductase n=1 Tax=Nocardia sp. NBC_01499 TaxID=2903597 RepID=UPI0038642DC7
MAASSDVPLGSGSGMVPRPGMVSASDPHPDSASHLAATSGSASASASGVSSAPAPDSDEVSGVVSASDPHPDAASLLDADSASVAASDPGVVSASDLSQDSTSPLAAASGSHQGVASASGVVSGSAPTAALDSAAAPVSDLGAALDVGVGADPVAAADLASPSDSDSDSGPDRVEVVRAGVDSVGARHVSRRTVLAAAWVSAGVAGLAVAGQTVPWLRWAAVLAPRSGEGAQGVPVNRSARAAGVVELARAADYRLTVLVGDRQRSFTRDELVAMPQVHARLPIACVEGWSASADWSGVRLRDLLAAVGAYPGGDVRFRSLETSGIYASSVLPQRHAVDSDTLVALSLNGQTLDVDHGYPCRLIAPSRPGVLQTKWLSTIEARS